MTLIRPIITYRSECWMLTQDQKRLKRFGRKIVRGIYGRIKISEAGWRIRNKKKINNILDNEDIVRFIRQIS